MTTATSGAALFARFAYPPNVLGYCGPADHRGVLEYAAGDVVDGGLVALARQFTGAWPYLELIAAAHGIDDPLDRRVVEAYWVGNELLEVVSIGAIAGSLDDRFRSRLGRTWQRLTELVTEGARPHHNFHVFGVYPWVGLLRSGSTDEPLRVLDRCRIRWGRVVGAGAPDRLMVRSQPLRWDGTHLHLGMPELESVRHATDGYTLASAREGDWVALHWDWACERLSPRGLRALRYYTLSQLEVVNRVAHPPPAMLLS